MKHMNEFVKFDFNAWADGKEFKVRGVYDWKDYKTGAILGKSVQCVIVKDECKGYKLGPAEDSFDLTYEKVTFKCNTTNVKVGDLVRIVNPNPVVYVNNGGFMDVSFKCESVVTKK